MNGAIQINIVSFQHLKVQRIHLFYRVFPRNICFGARDQLFALRSLCICCQTGQCVSSLACLLLLFFMLMQCLNVLRKRERCSSCVFSSVAVRWALMAAVFLSSSSSARISILYRLLLSQRVSLRQLSGEVTPAHFLTLYRLFFETC